MAQTETMSAHRLQACEGMSAMGKKLFRYVEFDDTEELIAEIRKHPIGAFARGITGAFISLIIVLATSALALNLDNFNIDFGDNSHIIKLILIAVGLVLGLLALAATALTVVIYRSSVIFITDQKIAEVMYVSIFNRKVTQLGVGSVEDVTVQQRGLFPRLFNYGTIVVETAGEVENCNFTMLPNPNFYSQKIIQDHELYVQKYGN
ncbi:MAG TPA: PH domain-containing protein [Patescibacteria group bacterium]|nr:PH domain-containing protein [Patescibacteria group bacterium]